MATNNVINKKHPIPAFSANLIASVNNVTGNSTVYTLLCDNIRFDTTSSYVSGTGIWTCPQSGRYLIGAGVEFSSLSGNGSVFNLIINNNATSIIVSNGYGYFTNYGGVIITNGRICVALTIGDIIKAQVVVDNNGGLNVGVTGGNATFFYGYLIY